MKRMTTILLLACACMLGGCAIEHLGDNTGNKFYAVMGKQTTVRLTDLDAPGKMTAEGAKVVQDNKKQDRKRGMLSQSGPRVLNLAR